ncbi:hypothetical protein WMY93_008961 [Mugilogobius chulae]|uniref:Uncharacterized protein n=1 Tax=Mugilogobius chulae TaxID=88201 RepID=A0AAW0PGM1_9GOBI
MFCQSSFREKAETDDELREQLQKASVSATGLARSSRHDIITFLPRRESSNEAVNVFIRPGEQTGADTEQAPRFWPFCTKTSQKHHENMTFRRTPQNQPTDRALSEKRLTVNSPQENVFVSEQQTTSLPLTAETHRDWDIITPLLSSSCPAADVLLASLQPEPRVILMCRSDQCVTRLCVAAWYSPFS